MRVRIDLDKMKTTQKSQEMVMANAKVLKSDWEIIRKGLKEAKVTWTEIIREVVRQLIKQIKK